MAKYKLGQTMFLSDNIIQDYIPILKKCTKRTEKFQ